MATIDKYKLEMDTRQATTSMKGLTTIVKGFVAVLAVDKIVDFGKAIVQSTKQFQTYENQLRLITNGSEDLNRVMGLLQQSAIASRTSFADFLDLFVKLRVTTDSLGIAEERVIAVTEKLSQALQVAGADTATATAVIRQFGQAMASGEVRGDEFRSIVEGLGPALAIMARESGLTVGELRKMSRAGELSAEVMFEMFEASEALTAAFNSQTTTLAQLEVAYDDALDRALVKFGESSFVGKAYQNVLESLTRTLDKYAETAGALVNIETPDIMQGITEGTFSAVKALKELEIRLEQAQLGSGGGSGRITSEQAKYLQELSLLEEILPKVRELAKAEEERAKAQQEQLRIATENQAELTRLLKEEVSGLDEIQAKAEKLAKLEFGTPFERATRKLEEAKKVLEELTKAQKVVTENAHLNEGGLKDFTDQIESTKLAIAGLTKEVADLADTGDTFQEFYDNVIKDSAEAVQQIEFTNKALEKLNESGLKDTAPLQYAEALKILGEELDKVEKNTKEINSSVVDFNTGLQEGIEDTQAELDQLNMNALEKQISDIELKFGRDLKKQIKELKELENLSNQAEIDKAIQEVTEASNEAKAQQIALAKEIHETQRSFAYGWKEAFESYEDEATNAAKNAERIFAKTTKGMEDMIVNFAKTGKFEFKSFVASILEDLLRAQIQQSIAQIFRTPLSGGGTAGSGLGNIFGGFFANGGFLPSGKFGIAGESGPELITGPANITPLDGVGGNVTYNINAVDALSFRQLVARDPGFIHAVAQKGGSAVPSRR